MNVDKERGAQPPFPYSLRGASLNRPRFQPCFFGPPSPHRGAVPRTVSDALVLHASQRKLGPGVSCSRARGGGCQVRMRGTPRTHPCATAKPRSAAFMGVCGQFDCCRRCRAVMRTRWAEIDPATLLAFRRRTGNLRAIREAVRRNRPNRELPTGSAMARQAGACSLRRQRIGHRSRGSLPPAVPASLSSRPALSDGWSTHDEPVPRESLLGPWRFWMRAHFLPAPS